MWRFKTHHIVIRRRQGSVRPAGAFKSFKAKGLSALHRSLDDKRGERAKCSGAGSEEVQRAQRGGELSVRLPAAPLDAEQGRIGVLPFAGVFPRGFSELLGGGRNVQQIVYNLEGQAQVPAERGHRLKGIGI